MTVITQGISNHVPKHPYSNGLKSLGMINRLCCTSFLSGNRKKVKAK